MDDGVIDSFPAYHLALLVGGEESKRCVEMLTHLANECMTGS